MKITRLDPTLCGQVTQQPDRVVEGERTLPGPTLICLRPKPCPEHTGEPLPADHPMRLWGEQIVQAIAERSEGIPWTSVPASEP